MEGRIWTSFVALTLDRENNIYLSGYTLSESDISKDGFQNEKRGEADAFLAKIAGCKTPFQLTPQDFSFCGEGQVDIALPEAGNAVLEWFDSPFAPSPFYVDDGQMGFSTPVLDTTTTYYVSANYAPGCNTGKIPITVTIHSLPQVTIQAQGDTALCPGESVVLDASSLPGTYLWQDGSSASTFTATEPGEYSVTVTDANGCVASDRITLLPKDCLSLNMPNVFTPNQDGINDEFAPINPTNIQDFELQVFDRWGKQVFASQQVQDGWDGTWKQQALPKGYITGSLLTQALQGIKDRRKARLHCSDKGLNFLI